MLLSAIFSPLVTSGRLIVVDARGRQHSFGSDLSPPVVVRLHDDSLPLAIAVRRHCAIGEGYMDGTLTMEQGSLYDLLHLLSRNLADAGSLTHRTLRYRAAALLRRIHQFNKADRARRNVAHHYDLSEALYRLFLDSDMQYSCAYFADPDDDLETAQLRKKRHIAAKLCLRPGQRVLDIGSGWGGFGLYLARTFGVEVTGVTLSEDQLRISNERARQADLASRVRFEGRDYRQQTGRFERIVSVGMFEHVGVNHFREYFDAVHRLLTDDGVMLLHTIGRVDGPGATDPWIRKYIFPGGYFPALSEIVPTIEKTGLWITDVEVLRLHYAETLRHWRQRFLANRERAAALFDERFCRMWEFYLAGSEVAFRHLGVTVFQIQLAKRQETLPLIRDYMVDDERALAVRGRRDGDRAA